MATDLIAINYPSTQSLYNLWRKKLNPCHVCENADIQKWVFSCEMRLDTVKGFFVLKLDELPTFDHNAYDDRQAMTRSFHEKFGAQQPGLTAGSHLTPKPPKKRTKIPGKNKRQRAGHGEPKWQLSVECDRAESQNQPPAAARSLEYS